MRPFAGFYFILRYLLIILYVISYKAILTQFPAASLTLFTSAVVIALTRPYKKVYMNVLDTLLLSLLGGLFHILSTDYTYARGILFAVAGLTPAIVFWTYFLFIIIFKMTQKYTTSWNITQEVVRYGSI